MNKPVSLRERALKWLAQREHSRSELARKLARYATGEDEVAPLLDELARRKLLSDDRYAEARAHVLARKFGVARIEHELISKGIEAPTIARVASVARATEFERARAAWRKRFGTQPASPTERAKQIRFLQARGFSFDVIRRVIRGTDEDA